MAKTLVKPCVCFVCGDPMAAGDAFRWGRVPRSRASYALGVASGFLVTVDVPRPRHDHDCLGAQVAADAKAARLREVDAACAYARRHGESEAEIAAYRARLLAGA